MASNQNCEVVGYLVNYAKACHFLPFEASLKPCLNLVTRKTKKWVFLTTYSLVVNILFISYVINVLLSSANERAVPDLIFLLGILNMYLMVLGPHVWLLIKLRTVESLINTYIKLNWTLCKFWKY